MCSSSNIGSHSLSLSILLPGKHETFHEEHLLTFNHHRVSSVLFVILGIIFQSEYNVSWRR